MPTAMLIINDTITIDRRRFGLLSLIVLAGVSASVLMYWVIDQGPGVSPDSTIYIEEARALLSGNGFFFQGNAVTHYPPAYPLLLAVVGLLNGGDILLAGRLLAALLFGVNLVLFGLAVQLCTRDSLAATACAIFIFLFSAPIISIHSMALSEAPFIMFSMASFVLLAHHIVRPSPYLLVIAALLAGFAAATRYIGVALFPSMAIVLLLLGTRSIKQVMRELVILVSIASLPLASWFIRNVVIAETVANREFSFHPFTLDHAKRLIISMYDFALPISVSGWTKTLHVGIAVALFTLGLAVLHRKMYIKQHAASVGIVLPTLCIFYSVTYVAFLVISVSFFDAHVPFDNRTLLPVFLALTVAGIFLAWSLSQALSQQCIWYSFLLFVLFSVSINAHHAISRAVDIHDNGIGYTSRYWRNSEIISYLSELNDARKIYSNGPDVIRFLTGQDAVMMPLKVSPYTGRVNENYEETLSLIVRECREGKALVAYLNAVTWRWYLPSIEEFESVKHVPVLHRMQDGVLYGTP